MGATLSYYRRYVYFKCCLINVTPFPATYNFDIYNYGRIIWELDEEKCPPPVAIYREANKDSPSPRQFDRYFTHKVKKFKNLSAVQILREISLIEFIGGKFDFT